MSVSELHYDLSSSLSNSSNPDILVRIYANLCKRLTDKGTFL
jgi:hypothetical protein